MNKDYYFNWDNYEIFNAWIDENDTMKLYYVHAKEHDLFVGYAVSTTSGNAKKMKERFLEYPIIFACELKLQKPTLVDMRVIGEFRGPFFRNADNYEFDKKFIDKDNDRIFLFKDKIDGTSETGLIVKPEWYDYSPEHHLIQNRLQGSLLSRESEKFMIPVEMKKETCNLSTHTPFNNDKKIVH